MFAIVLCGAAPAIAADLPADDSGKQAISDFVGRFFGQEAQKSLKIDAEGAAYIVSFSGGAPSPLLTSFNFSLAGETKLKCYRQEDGLWRVEQEEAQATAESDSTTQSRVLHRTTTVVNGKTRILLDPKIGWLSTAHTEADTLKIDQVGQGLSVSITAAKPRYDYKTTSGDGGLLTSAEQPLESIDLTFHLDPSAMNAQPKAATPEISVVAHAEKITSSAELAGFQPLPITDVLSFFANHRDRSQIAQDFDAFKTKLDALAADHAKLKQNAVADRVIFDTSRGAVTLDGVTIGLNFVNGGEDSGFGESIAIKSIKWPEGLLPPELAALAPSDAAVDFFADGFDLPGALQEWEAAADPQGAGPMLTQQQQIQVWLRLIANRPVVFEMRPSHVTGPNIDVKMEGKVTVDAGGPIGSFVIDAHDFDKTQQAIMGLSPEAQRKAVPLLAMAKGLAKQTGDGNMHWQVELAAEGVKVNGLPLGKPASGPAPNAPN